MMISSSGVRKQYKGVEVIRTPFEFTERITVIKGENGSGKSTILKAIAGCISYQGRIRVRGRVSYLPEKMIMVPEMTVGMYLNCLVGKENQTMKQLMSLFHLDKHKNKALRELSKGMHQKVRLVHCLSIDRDIYLLDEPFNGLDDEAVLVLKQFIEESTKYFVISTHLDTVFGEIQDVVKW